METVASSPAAPAPQLQFLTAWEQDPARTRQAGILSLAAHVALVTALILMPRSLMSPPAHPVTEVTPLIEPHIELTQQAPNKGKINKEITEAEVRPRARIHIPPSPPSTFRPAARHNVAPQTPLPEPPRIDAGSRAATPAALPAGPLTVQAPPPQIQPEEKPKLALEAPTAPPPSGGHGRIAAPDTSVSGAIRSLARNSSQGGLAVGDVSDLGIGGLGAELNQPPSPGRPASALQLLSNPLGVDFRPYLIQVLANVRRNWFAVYPESAKMGRRGRVEIQFAISKDGSVPKLVIVLASGTEAFDRAAVAGISASNPFPPLPSEYAGNIIRLQFTFLYNAPRR